MFVGAALMWEMSSGTLDGETLSIQVKDGRRRQRVGSAYGSVEWCGTGMLEAESMRRCSDWHQSLYILTGMLNPCSEEKTDDNLS